MPDSLTNPRVREARGNRRLSDAASDGPALLLDTGSLPLSLSWENGSSTSDQDALSSCPGAGAEAGAGAAGACSVVDSQTLLLQRIKQRMCLLSPKKLPWSRDEKGNRCRTLVSDS